MNNLNIAIVGYGGMGRHHGVDLIAREPHFTLVGAYDTDPVRNQLAQTDGVTAYDSFSSLLADDTIDVVLIVTPNDSHYHLAIQALQAGKHVFCEKPAMMSVAELDQVLAVAQTTGKTFMVHQNRRWDPDFLIIKRLYDHPDNPAHIGEVFQIESRVHGANGIPGDWRHQKAQGGGMVLDWGVHLYDQLLWLINSPIVNMESHLSYVLQNQVEDGFTTRLYFENGLQALVEVGTTNYIKLPRWYVKGVSGTAVIHDWDNTGSVIRCQDGTLPQHKNLVPIKAGAGFTKTMAPPAETDTQKLALPEPWEQPVSIYQNFYEVVVHGAAPVVCNQSVRQVMLLMEEVFRVAQTQ